MRNHQVCGWERVYLEVGIGEGLVLLCIGECGWNFVVVEWIVVVVGLVVGWSELEHGLELERRQSGCLCLVRNLGHCIVDRIDHHRSCRLQSWTVVVVGGIVVENDVVVVVVEHGIVVVEVERVVVRLVLQEDDLQMLGSCKYLLRLK